MGCLFTIAAGSRFYPYMSKLSALNACKPLSAPVGSANGLKVVTPLVPEVWEKELSSHPDQQFAQYISDGIRLGFRVGFNRHSAVLQSCGRNMKSAMEHPEIVSAYIAEEVALARMEKVSNNFEHSVHVSPFGVIPKKSKPGHWRLITDLSSPHGHSVNDGIDKELCSLSYTSIDDVVNCILVLGRGSLMAKMDIKQAYRNIPVHPENQPLLGVKWTGEYLIDKALPFGLRSAPLIFTAVADVLQWMMQEKGAVLVYHYLDDFITIGSPGSSDCRKNLDIILHVCRITGMPVEESKTEGPSPVIKFLGMELDSVAMEIRLPQDKLENLRVLLKEWKGKKAGRKRSLLSLIGSLQHAAKAVRQGRSFVCRLINVSTAVDGLDSFVRLNVGARSDIRWWCEYAAAWNGTSMLHKWEKQHPSVHVTSDASGTWGCGAYTGQMWFQFQWPDDMLDCHITIKELIPIVFAAAIWGDLWSGKSVLFHCDNAAVVTILSSGTSRDNLVMHLIRCLVFIAAKFNFIFSASHIPGIRNILADALSRNNAALFFTHVPQASSTQFAIPPELVDLLITSKPDWTSALWTNLWSSIFNIH